MWQDRYTPCGRTGILHATAQVYSMRRTGIACGRIGINHMAGKVYYSILHVAEQVYSMYVERQVYSMWQERYIPRVAEQVYSMRRYRYIPYDRTGILHVAEQAYLCGRTGILHVTEQVYSECPQRHTPCRRTTPFHFYLLDLESQQSDNKTQPS
jgi:hypothetical protein